MYSLFKVPWKFEKSYSPPLPLQIIPKQALKKEKRQRKMRYESLEPNKERRACCTGGKTRQKKVNTTEMFSFQDFFSLTHSRNSVVTPKLSAVEKIMSRAEVWDGRKQKVAIK